MRRDPFSEFERLFEEMRPLFEGGRREMAVDVAEDDGEFHVAVDLPGFDTSDIDLRIANDVLHLTAEHEEPPAEGEEFIRKERGSRSVARAIRLPAEVEAEGASATYQNGVLTVHVRKADPSAAEGRHVPIE